MIPEYGAMTQIVEQYFWFTQTQNFDRLSELFDPQAEADLRIRWDLYLLNPTKVRGLNAIINLYKSSMVHKFALKQSARKLRPFCNQVFYHIKTAAIHQDRDEEAKELYYEENSTFIFKQTANGPKISSATVTYFQGLNTPLNVVDVMDLSALMSQINLNQQSIDFQHQACSDMLERMWTVFTNLEAHAFSVLLSDNAEGTWNEVTVTGAAAVVQLLDQRFFSLTQSVQFFEKGIQIGNKNIIESQNEEYILDPSGPKTIRVRRKIELILTPDFQKIKSIICSTLLL